MRSSGHCRRPAAKGATASSGRAMAPNRALRNAAAAASVGVGQVEAKPRLAWPAQRIEHAERVLDLVAVAKIEKRHVEKTVEARHSRSPSASCTAPRSRRRRAPRSPGDPGRAVEVGVPARHEREVEGAAPDSRARKPARSLADRGAERAPAPSAAAGTATTRSTSRHGAARSKTRSSTTAVISASGAARRRPARNGVVSTQSPMKSSFTTRIFRHAARSTPARPARAPPPCPRRTGGRSGSAERRRRPGGARVAERRRRVGLEHADGIDGARTAPRLAAVHLEHPVQHQPPVGHADRRAVGRRC